MVAEGRVWEFYCSEGSQNPCPQQELYRWQFSGTAEKDGRTWNRLMRVGSVKWRGSDPESGSSTTPRREVALMRQEDNRVWVLDNAGERLMKSRGPNGAPPHSRRLNSNQNQGLKLQLWNFSINFRKPGLASGFYFAQFAFFCNFVNY